MAYSPRGHCKNTFTFHTSQALYRVLVPKYTVYMNQPTSSRHKITWNGPVMTVTRYGRLNSRCLNFKVNGP